MQKVVQLLRITRFSRRGVPIALLLALIFSSLTFQAHGQDLLGKKIHFIQQATSIKDALIEVQKQSGIKIIYGEAINRFPQIKITANIKEITVKAAVELILKNTTLQYTMMDDHILINEKMASKIPNVAAGQRAGSGSIEGTITDQKTKETLIGVTVQLIGGKQGTQTDANGKFRISNIPVGSYQLNVSYVGYQKPKPFYVDIRANETTTINFTLTSDSKELSQVIVVGSRSRATDAGTLDMRRNSNNAQDVVSAQQIQATASINTAQALQKAVGVSITDNKYVVVRGMTDRNVVVQMNGTRLSGANNDRNAVAMDIIPASLLDYVSVEKTTTPDKPADATAGLVELHTKTFPDSLVIQFSMQSGFNDQIGTGGNITSFQNSDLGTFGQNFKNHRLPQDLVDLAGYYPGGGNLGSSRDINTKTGNVFNNSNMAYYTAGAIYQNNTNAAKNEVLHINQVQEELDPVITTSQKQVTPNQNYALSFGNRYKISGKDVGVVAGVNYTRNTNIVLYGKLNQYSLYNGLGTPGVTTNPLTSSPLIGPDVITPNHLWLVQRYALQDNNSQEQVSYGGFGSVSLRLNRHHDFSINYLINKGFESTGASENGFLPAFYNAPVQEYQLRTTERTLNNFQLQGNHTFGETLPITFNWKIGTSHSSQEDPDYRNISVYQDPRDNSYNYVPYTLNGRFFRNLTEKNNSYQADLSIPFLIRKIKIASKTGGFYFKRTRDYDETFLKLPDLGLPGGSRYLPDFSPLLNQNGGNLNLLVSPNIIGTTSPLYPQGQFGQSLTDIGVGPGWFYYPIKTLNNYHGAYQQNTSLYEMLTVEPTKWLKVIGGVRFENTKLHAQIDTTGKRYTFDADHLLTGGSSVIGLDSLRSYTANLQYKLQPFPSATFIAKINKVMNLRGTYSKTLGRPELRELIPTAQFDPYQQALVVGNENLINSTSQNADLRWEWFRKDGEVFAISLFYKRIDHQLEKTFQYSGQANYSVPLVTYRNNPEEGTVQGIELELRKDLGEFSPVLKNFTLGGNLLLANSFTKLSPGDYGVITEVDRNVKSERPLFDQPNYVLNCYLTYFNRPLGTTVNFYFNSTGQRLTQVNLDGSPNIYELPVSNLDLIINKRLTKRVTMNAYVKNMLDGAIRFAYTTQDGGGKYGTYNQTYYYRDYHTGREVALGFSYLF